MALTYREWSAAPGYAGRGTCSVLRRGVSGSYWGSIPGRGRLLKRFVSWSVDRFVWHVDPAKVGRCISAVSGTKATGHGRWASGLIMSISMDQPDLQFNSKMVMSTIAKLLEITKSRLRKIARYLEDKPVLEYVCTYQNEVAECMAFGDSDWARDRETRGAGEAGNPLHRERLLHPDSDRAQLALQRAAAGAVQTQHISTGWGRPLRAIVRSDSTAAICFS